MKRGSGETIWDIKKHIGLVSSSLQWEYRATTNADHRDFWFIDSIGLYQAAGDDDRVASSGWKSSACVTKLIRACIICRMVSNAWC